MYKRLAVQAAQEQAIQSIKTRILDMLAERSTLAGELSTNRPSDLWSAAGDDLAYLMDLPEKHFASLRKHTYHVTGDIYIQYLAPSGCAAFLRSTQWADLTRHLPPECALREPETGIGFRLADGRLVSHDLARFQTQVLQLYSYGILPALIRADRHGHTVRILEIGPGMAASRTS